MNFVFTDPVIQHFIVLAQQQPAPRPQSPLFLWGMILFIFAFFYLFIIRPQARQAKERQAMLSSVQKGNRVLFGGGIIGTVANLKENTVTIKVGDNIKLEVVRGAISRVIEKDDKLTDDPHAPGSNK